MRIFNIDDGNIRQLIRGKIPLECAYVLEVLNAGGDVGEECNKFLQYLQRKGYITHKGEVTKYGKALYEGLFQKLETENAPPAKKALKKDDGDFEKWWEIYPPTNHFEHKGKTFEGTQKKNVKKEECKKLFFILTNGEFTAHQVIEATKYHINAAKDLSIKKRDNQLNYVPNSERYLRERYFEPYIKFIDKEAKPEEGFEI